MSSGRRSPDSLCYPTPLYNIELDELKVHLRFSFMRLAVTATSCCCACARARRQTCGVLSGRFNKDTNTNLFHPMKKNRDNETTLGCRDIDAYISLSGASSGCV